MESKMISLYFDEPNPQSCGFISFNNKISPKMLEAIEQEVINYELAELNINNQKEVKSNGNT